ncbi:hypothetical protein BGZ65_003053 [Modicella reniformis]|uniref:Lethal giant larvae (Lgl)-like C-terminal domain-containing protein n=1 Tax=Modicella reniformis TaxID=1440133 RepID=A0A9P6IZY6_9FUNG|nr:hypothetical protein BGZ65_003053 [Modicella reniformis]
MAVDPVQGLLACGTFKGAIAVTGAPDLAGYLELEEAVSVKMMTFQPGSPVLIVVDAKNAITVFDLIKRQRLFVRNARSIVTCMQLLSGSNWLFHGLRDGTVDVFDVYRGQAVPYRIPNILPEGNKHSLVISIKAHPRDNNQLLIAYNTGVALWNLKQKSVIRTFIYEIPPGAMGGVSAGDGTLGLNGGRYPQVTVISWRPDGIGFVSGYDDGCFVFWDIRQEKPVLARTIHEINVNIPGTRPASERDAAQFVPIYQLSWCFQGRKDETTLIVAGGTGSIDPYGLHLFDFTAKPDYRNPKRHYTLTLESDMLDFVVLPRESPWFNGALDPVSILVLTNRGGVISFGFASPIPQALPSTLSFIEPRLIAAKVYGQLPQDLYNHLVNGRNHGTTRQVMPRIPLRGIQLGPIDDSRLCRDILVTAHGDRSIRFWEGATFRPLHHLTVELDHLFFKDQVEIVMFEFSVYNQVLVVGFSNGNWIYGRPSIQSGLSRQPSHARTMTEEFEAEALLADLKDVMIISEHEHQTRTGEAYPSDTNQKRLPRSPHQPIPEHAPAQPLQNHPVLPRELVPKSVETQAAPQPNDSKTVSPSALVYEQGSTPQEQQPLQQQQQQVPINQDFADANPEVHAPDIGEVLNHPIPSAPVDPIVVRDLPTGELNPGSPPPNRAPSPSLPPRPAFVEVSLPKGSEFSNVFKSSSHLGRINQIAVSKCGLVAVSDEFYAISITDTHSGRVLHVEDLKVVMLDREKNEQPQGTPHDSDTNRPNNHGDQAPVDPKTLQRVGVVITTLQFVVSTTSDQDKTPSLLLIAGSTNGIYLIFAISPSPIDESVRQVRKVETFQTKEQYASIHTSIINVISLSETPASDDASSQSTASSTLTPSTATATAVSSTGSMAQTQAALDPMHHHSPSRRSGDESRFVSGHRPSLSEPSASEGSSSKTTSVYSTLKDAQGKVISKAQQRLNYLVCVSEFGIRLHMNCTSRRINKVDFSSSDQGHAHHDNQLSSKYGRILAANVVYHQGACCILCVAESGRILLFSVPKLDLIPLPVPGGELRLPIVMEPERLREAVILSDGRIFVPILKYEFRLYSLWGHDRWVRTPQGLIQERSAESSTFLQLYDHGIQIPPRPTNTPTSPTFKDWFGFGSSAEEAPSQEDLDELLGGEHYRAENPILRRAGVQGPPGTKPLPPPKDGGATTGLSGMMNETLQGLNERGQKLGAIGDKTAEMRVVSNDFLAAARELNAKNANKKWYDF